MARRQDVRQFQDIVADSLPQDAPLATAASWPPVMGPVQGSQCRDAFPLDQLADRDVLFAILSQCMPWARAAEATAQLLKRYTTFADAIAAGDAELELIDPLGPTGIALLRAIKVAAVRLCASPLKDSIIIDKKSVLIEYLCARMSRNQIESARCLYLNTKNRLISDEELGSGDVRGVYFSTRELVRRAVLLNSSAVILVHNHPAGDPKPSHGDIEKTQEIIMALHAVGIRVHDHYVIGHGCYASIKELGLLNFQPS
jgi:DNA repair protein RadC